MAHSILSSYNETIIQRVSLTGRAETDYTKLVSTETDLLFGLYRFRS